MTNTQYIRYSEACCENTLRILRPQVKRWTTGLGEVLFALEDQFPHPASDEDFWIEYIPEATDAR